MMRTHRAFTLVEMIVATVLAALLMGGVLLMTAAIARDRNRVTQAQAGPQRTHSTMEDLFQFDLTNALTMSPAADGKSLVLVGHGGMDAQTLRATGRLTRVTYEVRGRGADSALFRTQEYLDEPARPQAWTELVGDGVMAFGVTPESGDFEAVKKGSQSDEDEEVPGKVNAVSRRAKLETFTMPSRVRLRVQRTVGGLEREMWLR